MVGSVPCLAFFYLLALWKLTPTNTKIYSFLFATLANAPARSSTINNPSSMEPPVLSFNSNDTTNNGNCTTDFDIITWFEDVSKNAGSVQTQTLCKILKQNYGVEYLKTWLGSYNISEMDACALESLFTSVVPLASHADFEPYIQKIADGDTGPILTQQPITTLSLRYYCLFVYLFTHFITSFIVLPSPFG